MALHRLLARPKLRASAFALVAALPVVRASTAQATPAAAALLAFDVAAVRQSNSTSTGMNSNVMLGPGNVYTPTGGLFRATNVPLVLYVAFAYRMNDAQLAAFRSAAPAWALQDRFDIQARTDNTAVTKDQLRLMMRSLLAERFALAMHPEMREAPAYALLLVHPETTGPRLRPHPAGTTCTKSLSAASPDQPAPPEAAPDGFPATCGGLVLLPATVPGRIHIGASDIPISLIAGSLSGWGGLGRPAVDETGLKGSYDFTLEYSVAASSPTATDADGPGFQQALKEQLGLKLEPQKTWVQIFVLDHIAHPTAN